MNISNNLNSFKASAPRAFKGSECNDGINRPETLSGKTSTEEFVGMIEDKLNKNEKGRSAINKTVGILGFAAGVMSLRRFAPKARGIAGDFVQNVIKAPKISKFIQPDAVVELDGKLTKKLGENLGGTISKGLNFFGIKTNIDAQNTVLAGAVAAFAGDKAGDYVEDEVKEATIVDAVKQVAKIASEGAVEI